MSVVSLLGKRAPATFDLLLAFAVIEDVRDTKSICMCVEPRYELFTSGGLNRKLCS